MIEKIEKFLIILNLVSLVFLVTIKLNPTARWNLHSFCVKHNIYKEEIRKGSYYDENHPNCYLTKESSSDKQSCINNNGIWSFKYKACFCQIPLVS